MGTPIDKKSYHNYVLLFCAVVSCICVLVPLRDVLLSCDDSISNFIYARITDSHFSFQKTFEFSLMRGKVDILFPIVITLRDYLYRKGNYVVFWLMQYIPVYMNVVMLGVFLARKLKTETGLLFITLFSCLLQINGWHSLIICYPVEFMYGLFVEQVGIILFDAYLSRPSNRKAIQILRLSLSLICYYEAMQTYEAFLLFGLVYAFLVYFAKENMKERLIGIIPHFVVAVIYIAIFVFLNLHPVVESNGYNITTAGTIDRMLITDLIFSFGMFPLTNILFPSIFKGINFADITVFDVCKGLVAGIAVYFVINNSNYKKIKIETLLRIAAVSTIMALIFPAFHAYTSKYQVWAIEGHQFGYITSTISYFGWITALICVVSALYIKFSNKEVFIRVYKVVLIILAVFATIMTGLINTTIRKYSIGPTSPDLSCRAQAMFMLAQNDSFASEQCDCLYVPDYIGIHESFQDNQYIVNYETDNGVNIWMTNDLEEFVDWSEKSDNPMVFRYMRSSNSGILFLGPDISDGHIYSSEFMVLSPHGTDSIIEIELDNGEIVTYEVNLRSGETQTFNIDGAFTIEDLRMS